MDAFSPWRLLYSYVCLSCRLPFPVTHPVFLGFWEFSDVCLSETCCPQPQWVILLAGFLSNGQRTFSTFLGQQWLSLTLLVKEREAERINYILFSCVYRLNFEIFSQEECSRRKMEAHQPPRHYETKVLLLWNVPFALLV